MTTLCIVSARNLGDAVLHADFLIQLQRAGYSDRWIVWTFPAARFLFEGLPNTEIVCSGFPIGATSRQFFRSGWQSFMSAVWTIRRSRPDETLDLVGDFRERFAMSLLGAPVNHSPEWESGHPFRLHNRMLSFRPGRLMTVPVEEINLYAAHARLLRALAPAAAIDNSIPMRIPLREGRPLRIGLHPSASAPFKLWPKAQWTALVELMSERFPGSSFTLFGSQLERPALEELAATLRAPHELFTGSLSEFKNRISSIDLLFGLDSFSVHLAHSQGVPSVVLVGANDPRIFTPPTGIAVTHPGRCKFQPCGGRPRCKGTDFEYSCMTDITPEDAIRAVPAQKANHTILPIVNALAP